MLTIRICSLSQQGCGFVAYADCSEGLEGTIGIHFLTIVQGGNLIKQRNYLMALACGD